MSQARKIKSSSKTPELHSEFVSKCFLLRENLLISILKMATGKELDDLTEDDAKKLSLVARQGVPGKETVLYDGKEVGSIICELNELKVLYTFSPIELPNDERSVATKMPKEQNDDNQKIIYG